MSKQIKSNAARTLALLFCLSLVTIAPLRAQVQSAPPPAVNPRAATIAAATDEVLRETSEIRKLAVLRPVKSGAQSRAEIERMLVKNLDLVVVLFGPAHVHAQEHCRPVLALGAARPGIDLQEGVIRIGLARQQASTNFSAVGNT